MQLVLQHRCKTSWIAMLLTTKTNVATLFVTGQAKIWVVKRATSFVSTCYNLSRNNKVATFVFVGSKTCNIAIQLVLEQCCKTSCTCFVASVWYKTRGGGRSPRPLPWILHCLRQPAQIRRFLKQPSACLRSTRNWPEWILSPKVHLFQTSLQNVNFLCFGSNEFA